VVRVATDIKTNKLAFFRCDVFGIKVADGIDNAKWLFGRSFFVLGLGATHGSYKAKGCENTPSNESDIFHVVTNK
jgi:hypothetical protein